MPYHSLRTEYSLFFSFFLLLLVYLPHLLLHHYHSEVNHKNTPPLENGMVLFQVIHSSRSGQTCFHRFFLPLFVGIKCQVAQVHFIGAGKYCWEMLLFLYVANQGQICPSRSKISESSYGVDTLLEYFDHTSQE